MAEVDEALSAAQNAGWNCGASNGEDLSRVLATALHPRNSTGSRPVHGSTHRGRTSSLTRLLHAAQGNRFEALYTIAVTTGMREGELLGLRWRNVDIEGRKLHVVGSLQNIPGEGWTIVEPKTTRSRRVVVIGEVGASALRRHRATQAEHRLRAGDEWVDLDLVFPNRFGKPMLPSNLLIRSFHPLLAKEKLPRVRFHDLRHTAASLLLDQGIHPKIVSEVLGHSSVGITLDLYSHDTDRGAPSRGCARLALWP